MAGCDWSVDTTPDWRGAITSQEHNTEPVQRLIESGARVNGYDEEGVTPLMWAIYRRNNTCVRTLIAAGADVNKLDFFGNLTNNPFASRSDDSSVGVFGYWPLGVSKVMAGLTPLAWAILNGDVNCLNILIGAGADVNLCCTDLSAPLLYAVATRDMNKVRVLVQAGALVNRVDRYLKTALHYAAQNGMAVCVKYLLRKGAEVDRFDACFRTALTYACLQKKLKSVSALLSAGAIVTVRNMILAVSEGNTEYILPFLKAGALVNTNNHHILYTCLENLDSGRYRHLVEVMIAGGESITRAFVRYARRKKPDVFDFMKGDATLKHQCRKVIRRHLMCVDYHENLFVRIPKLGLPRLLQSYLLFDVVSDV